MGGQYVCRKDIPFGLRSATLDFSALADALQYMMFKNGNTFIDHTLTILLRWAFPDPMNVPAVPESCIVLVICPVESGKSNGQPYPLGLKLIPWQWSSGSPQ